MTDSSLPPVTELPVVDVVAGVIGRDGKILIARRAAHKHLGGKWEFPGGKIEPDETPEAALTRELKEEFGIKVRVGKFIAAQTHTYPTIRVHLMAYHVELITGDFTLDSHDVVEWINPGELAQYDLAEADRFLIGIYV